MIGRISGILLERQAPELLIDVQGIGYEVLVSLTTFFELPPPGQSVVLHTHFVVREDAQQLYGFSELAERELFRHLIKVSGVGPKMALAILSGMNAGEFVRTVQDNDVATLVRLPGVGKKTAERLIVEMRDRLKDFAAADLPLPERASSSGVSEQIQEAESALVALGYKPQEAARMVNAVANDAQSSQELIRLALKSMVKS
ncbi:MAG: Holliday junction branch migration protein RuvA [Porticoccaceae bacterium]